MGACVEIRGDIFPAPAMIHAVGSCGCQII